jgi:asparagine synthase (glutamine-hydrolysing)
MSIIFGVKAADDLVVEESYLRKLAESTDRYAPDGTFILLSANVGMGFQAYQTHERSRLEVQPLVDPHGNMLTFDGRLDNHEELRESLSLPNQAATDSEIVVAAFRRWGERCFARLTGDWALALWSKRAEELYLARDHAGTRTLYYELREDRILWATYLETFFVERSTRVLDEVYAACYLACRPIRDLTPYKGIHGVPPAHYLRIQKHKISRRPHWNWLAKEQICYRRDFDYQEHFFSLFRQAVARRTGHGAPILAQLSGGMDSSSIVCMSDHIRKEQGAQPEDLLDTISYYDDREPSWDEKPYFSLLEARRQHPGIHIRTSFFENTSRSPDDLPYATYLLPGGSRLHLEKEREFLARISGRNYRVLLSGIGGDELLGGNPTPFPELADYLVAGRMAKFFDRTVEWCLARREPLFELVAETVAGTFKLYTRACGISSAHSVPWLSRRLRAHLKNCVCPTPQRLARFSKRPTTLGNGDAWWSIMETLPHRHPHHLYRLEFRYPFLDKDLVEFLFAIPRSQLLRPNRRRYLMRAALRNVVPLEILERKRKATMARGPIELQDHAPSILNDLFEDSLCAAHSLIDLPALRRICRESPQENNQYWWSQFMSTISYELWLRGFDRHGHRVAFAP